MVELHCHLDGSLEPEDVAALAKSAGISLPTDDPAALRQMLTADPHADLGSYLTKFALPLSVLQTAENITEAVRRVLTRLHRQGILHAEIRFAPSLHTKSLSRRQVVEAAVAGLATATAETGISASLILCMMRGKPEAENCETVSCAAAFHGRGVSAVDLAGDEARYPVTAYRELFSCAQQCGVPFTIHAGEAAGAESVAAAIDLGAARIGHGVRAMEDPALVKRLAERQIVLETCFTSNYQTGAVSENAAHPLRRFLEQGVLATLAVDNGTVSGTDLRQEYQKAKAALSLTDEQLLQVALNAVEGAFLPPDKKQTLRQKVMAGFADWIK